LNNLINIPINFTIAGDLNKAVAELVNVITLDQNGNDLD
jgi:hypothetical protein